MSAWIETLPVPGREVDPEGRTLMSAWIETGPQCRQCLLPRVALS